MICVRRDVAARARARAHVRKRKAFGGDLSIAIFDTSRGISGRFSVSLTSHEIQGIGVDDDDAQRHPLLARVRFSTQGVSGEGRGGGGIQSLGFARRAAFTHRNSAVGKFLICDLIIGLGGSESVADEEEEE